MELFATEFMYSQLFWTAISFATLLLIMAKFVVPAVTAVLDARAEKIRTDLNEAARLKKEAEDALANYEKQIKAARQEAASIINNARIEAENISQSRLKELEQELAHKSDTARKSIEQAKVRALQDVQKEVAEMVILTVEKTIGETLDAKKAEEMTGRAIKELAH